MPTLETVEVKVVEPVAPQSHSSSPPEPVSQNKKREATQGTGAKRVTPSSIPTKTNKPTQMKMHSFFTKSAKKTKQDSPPTQTPVLDAARRSELMTIVVGRTPGSGRGKQDSSTKKLDFEDTPNLNATSPTGDVCMQEVEPAIKRQKLDASDDVKTAVLSVGLAKKRDAKDITPSDTASLLPDDTQSVLKASKKKIPGIFNAIKDHCSPLKVLKSPDSPSKADHQSVSNTPLEPETIKLPAEVSRIDSALQQREENDFSKPELGLAKHPSDALTENASRMASESQQCESSKEIDSSEAAITKSSSITFVEKESRIATPSKCEHPKEQDSSTAVVPKSFSHPYKLGDRLQVLWSVESEDGEVNQRWWTATLLADNGANCTLEYDPYPEGGFDESSREEVNITAPHSLVSNGEIMFLRREGEDWTGPSSKDDIGCSKQQEMLSKYLSRAKELLSSFEKQLRSEAPLDISVLIEEIPGVDVNVGFPDCAVKALVALIEGRSDPLDILSIFASDKLAQMYKREFTHAEVSSKIKLFAERKKCLKDTWLVTGEAKPPPVNIFKDESPYWRWEVITLELLPTDWHSRVKKARSARRKISSYWNSMIKLVKSLQSKLLTEKVWARISHEEEKLLKHEREAEKARLALTKADAQDFEQSKPKSVTSELRAKQQDEKKAEKQREKARKDEEKRLEKERMAAEKERKKVEQAEKKRQQESEKQAEKERAQARQQKLLAKQQSRLLSVFKPKPQKKDLSTEAVDYSTSDLTSLPEPMNSQSDSTFDAGAFRGQITDGSFLNSSSTFQRKFSGDAKYSRRPKTRRVRVPVEVAVYPDNPFDFEPYRELREVEVLNKYKFFLFHEDIRPPYYGTWSKVSRTVSGRTPFKHDEALDYENDSEAEWEEGDDEVGDECEDEPIDDEDDKDDENDEGSEDGWLAADDEILEDLDDETKERLRKQNEVKTKETGAELTVRIIAPHEGGPPSFTDILASNEGLEGFSVQEANDLLRLHAIEDPTDQPSVCIDPFPSSSVDEMLTAESQCADEKPAKEMSQADQRSFIEFVQNSSIGSKEKLVDELRSAHPMITNSRAQALRTLETVGEKVRLETGSTCWRVKKDFLTTVGLEHLAKAEASEGHDALMKLAAEFIHHKAFTSRDKAVDELRYSNDKFGEISRAECLRILDAVAIKQKSVGGVVFWTVRKSMEEKLEIELPPELSSTQWISKTTAEENVVDTLKKCDAENSSKKRKAAPNGAPGSSKILEMFLKNKKTT